MTAVTVDREAIDGNERSRRQLGRARLGAALASEPPCRSRLNHSKTPPFLFSLASGEQRTMKSSSNGDDGEPPAATPCFPCPLRLSRVAAVVSPLPAASS
nr:hypothetical protein Iba_chr12eCG5770 [Ipomoea batatas]